MSWSAHYPDKKAMQDNTPNYPIPPLSREAQEQLDFARKIAAEIVNSGVIGSPDFNYGFGMNGHANPKHNPAKNMANDFLTISVIQVTTPNPTDVPATKTLATF
jgi:hypothetical protein